MDIIQISNILTQLVVRYPGGLQAFKDEGGSITAIPTPSNALVITHPNLPDEIRAAFEKMAEENFGEPAPHPVIQEVPNFFNTELAEKREILSKLAVDLSKVSDKISIGETPGVLIITARCIKMNSKKAQAVRDIAQKLSDVTLAYFLWRDGSESMTEDDPIQKKAATSEIYPLTENERQQVQAEIDQLLNEIGGLSGPSEDT